jgi:hypothetical protein
MRQIGFFPNDDPGDGYRHPWNLSGRFEDAAASTFGPTGRRGTGCGWFLSGPDPRQQQGRRARSSPAHTLLPPVPPASLPPGAVGYEYETIYGAPTGLLDITATLFFDSNPTISDPTGDPAFPPAGDWQASTFRVRLVPSTAYTWNHAAPAPITPVSWLPGSVTSGYPLVAEVGFDGTGHAELDLSVSTNIASLDAGAYTLLIVSSLIEDGATPTPPHNTDPLGHKVRVSAEARQALTGDTVLIATVHYRPPRYRFLYDTLPRLRQFPRDDALGGSPRQGKTNGPTSVQGSTRQGWRGTYR